MRSATRGFSLIELMIAVVIVGILAAVALPSYSSYVLRSNRTVGKTVIMRIAGQQESFFTDRQQYAATLNGLSPDYGADPVYLTRDGKAQTANTSDTIYSVTLAAYTAASVANCSASGTPTATQFAIVATPVNAQLKDTTCGKLCLGSTGDKGAAGSGGATCWKS